MPENKMQYVNTVLGLISVGIGMWSSGLLNKVTFSAVGNPNPVFNITQSLNSIVVFIAVSILAFCALYGAYNLATTRQLPNAKVLIALLLLSFGLTGFKMGMFSAIGFSSVGGENTVVLPAEPATYNVGGREVTYKDGLFYVNDKPLYNGEVVDGVWMAQRSEDAALLVYNAGLFASTVKCATSGDYLNNPITPPDDVWVKPTLKVGQLSYAHAKGNWDYNPGTSYNSIFFVVEETGEFGGSVYRKRTGSYNTETTSDSTLKNVFSFTPDKAGTYTVKVKETYDFARYSSCWRVASFTAQEDEEVDETDPTINNVEVKPETITPDTIAVSFKAYVTDNVGVARVWAEWGSYKFSFTHESGNVWVLKDVSPKAFGCDTTTRVKVYAKDFAGNYDSYTLSVSRVCAETSPPTTTPPIAETKWCERLGEEIPVDEWTKEKCDVPISPPVEPKDPWNRARIANPLLYLLVSGSLFFGGVGAIFYISNRRGGRLER